MSSYLTLDQHPSIKSYKDVDINSNFQLKDYKLVLDSGAHSLYTAKFSGAIGMKGKFSRTHSNYEFAQSEEFKSYLEDYIQFLHINKDYYDMYVTLDLIFEPKLSWEVTEYIESQGLNPIPVFHYGEDFEWLKKMIDRYDYIGIGGLGQDVTKSRFKEWAEKVFGFICGPRKNDEPWKNPKIKTHGFAVAATELITEYPWYSCDSSTWTTLGRTGSVYIPHPVFSNKHELLGFDYLHVPLIIPATARRAKEAIHIDNRSKTITKYIEQYLSQFGITINDLKYDYDARDMINMWFYFQLEKQSRQIYKNYDWNNDAPLLYLAGTPSGASTNINRLSDLIYKTQAENLNLLSSFWYKKYNLNCVALKKAYVEGRSVNTIKDHRSKLIMRRKSFIEDTSPIPNLTSLFKESLPKKSLTRRVTRTNKSTLSRKQSMQLKKQLRLNEPQQPVNNTPIEHKNLSQQPVNNTQLISIKYQFETTIKIPKTTVMTNHIAENALAKKGIRIKSTANDESILIGYKIINPDTSK